MHSGLHPTPPRGWATCQSCGHRHKGYVREIEGELLERCPTCGAYDWMPEPIKVGVTPDGP